MGFKETVGKVIRALRAGDFQFEKRAVVRGKNLLDTGEISVDEVIGLLNRCKGPQYQTTPHHWDQNTICHIFKPQDHEGNQWYIKVYFPDDDSSTAVFISIH